MVQFLTGNHQIDVIQKLLLCNSLSLTYPTIIEPLLHTPVFAVGRVFECSAWLTGLTGDIYWLQTPFTESGWCENHLLHGGHPLVFRSYNFEELSDTPLIQEDHAIMSFITDNSDRYALLNIATQGVHMWDIRAR